MVKSPIFRTLGTKGLRRIHRLIPENHFSELLNYANNRQERKFILQGNRNDCYGDCLANVFGKIEGKADKTTVDREKVKNPIFFPADKEIKAAPFNECPSQ